MVRKMIYFDIIQLVGNNCDDITKMRLGIASKAYYSTIDKDRMKFKHRIKLLLNEHEYVFLHYSHRKQIDSIHRIYKTLCVHSSIVKQMKQFQAVVIDKLIEFRPHMGSRTFLRYLRRLTT
jgi:hypothetical protein